MADTIIENPTYMEHVRHFFDDVDLEHMIDRLDLTTYPALKDAAADVYLHTRPPNAHMPPEPERKWSRERWQSFRNWIDGFPLGAPVVQPVQGGTAARIRKDARALSGDEIEMLGRAFRGIMDRPPDHEQSYFFLAGQHWYPAPPECLHHEDRYHPWHRVFIRRFEDALRSVEGCAEVTLPYWDITAAPPDFLFTPPFDSYTLPRDIHRDMDPDRDYPAGHATTRHSSAGIMARVEFYDIPNKIRQAMSMFDWNMFTNNPSGIEVGGHDNGHVATGQTMKHPDAAAYDPIFWFFHSNWDRLWWEWQQGMQATTQWSFRSTVTTGATEFLGAPFNELRPFTETAEQVIDLSATGVGYATSATAVGDEAVRFDVGLAEFGSAAASRKIRVRPGPLVSIRLKGIDRLTIPGSFHAVLKADGEPLARQAFFQSTRPRTCTACREKPLIDLDFRVPADAVIGKEVTADIELLAPGAERIGARFPLRYCGDPTLNVRLLLQEAS